MARDTLGYQYTGNEDTSRMPGNEVDDEDIVERLGRIFKDIAPVDAKSALSAKHTASRKAGFARAESK
jgi:ABC-type oligopeptide transport system substrate-binding subunit